MRSVRYLAVLAVLLLSASASHAQVSIGIGGPVYGGYYGPPACQYGYYSYYPYTCAPYGYYGPQWFNGGVFIGAGPWYGRGWGGWGDGREGGWRGREGWGGDEGWHGDHGGGYYAGNRAFAARGGWHGDGRGGFHGGGGWHGGGRGGFHGGGHGGGRH